MTVIGPRKGICKPPLLELSRETDPGGDAVRVDLVDGATNADKATVRKAIKAVEGVDSIGNVNKGKSLRVLADEGVGPQVIAAVEGNEKVKATADVPTEDPRLVKCKDDAKTALAIGAPLLLIGLVAFVFGLTRFIRAGRNPAAETPPAETPPTTE